MRLHQIVQRARRCLAGAPDVTASASPRQSASQRLGVEVLEDRAVPAILGTAGGDVILVEYDGWTGSTNVFVNGALGGTIGPGGSDQVDALNGNDVVIVKGLGPGVFLGIDAGKDDDTILLCPDSRDLGNIQGYLGVGGSVGYDQLILNDSAWGGGDTYTITAQTIQVAGLPSFTVGYGNLEYVQLTTGGGNDTVRVPSVAPGTAYFVDTGAGWDTFEYLIPNSSWKLDGLNHGTVDGVATFANAENLTSGVGNDTFYFTTPGAGVSGIIDGGLGVDGLNYLGNFPGAFVTLPSGPATATGGVANFEWWAL